MAPDTWSGVVTAGVAVLALLGGAVSTVWVAFRRFCARIDQSDDKLAALERAVRRLLRANGINDEDLDP